MLTAHFSKEPKHLIKMIINIQARSQKKQKVIFYCISLMLFFSACTKEESPEPLPTSNIMKYIHISHTRTNTNPLMDKVIERTDYSKYDMKWLGGDLAYLTSQDDRTMSHADSIFDFGSPNTLWSLGNHDYTDLAKIQDYTHRAPYYSSYIKGITFIVLDTQDSMSNIIGAQKDFFEGVIDTLQTSSHLVILHHKLIWMYGEPNLEPEISSISNGPLGDCFYCINPNNFYAAIYPKLLEVKEKGIEVLCIGGDIGHHVKEFEYISSDGIYFLASGISTGSIDNKALIFHHDPIKKALNWEYCLISNL